MPDPLVDTGDVGIARQAVADGLLRLACVSPTNVSWALTQAAEAVHNGTLEALISKVAKDTCNDCDGFRCPNNTCTDPVQGANVQPKRK